MGTLLPLGGEYTHCIRSVVGGLRIFPSRSLPINRWVSVITWIMRWRWPALGQDFSSLDEAHGAYAVLSIAELGLANCLEVTSTSTSVPVLKWTSTWADTSRCSHQHVINYPPACSLVSSHGGRAAALIVSLLFPETTSETSNRLRWSRG